ncbi:MAG: 2-vinyl bacteriochlorophyllide hydratase [Gemmatimonadaceae bacterium]|nr:2-vinyl bacteriochlorophyllide hydratase [Gemmatimonadaceae bacterium]
MTVPISTSSPAAAPSPEARPARPSHQGVKLLYTDEQRVRRNASKWTVVQGVLAPLQLLVCLISAVLVIRYLRTGDGLGIANASVLVKTAVLYTIMVTGAIWEHDVYGQYLFAEAFWWEDAVSMVVIALHTLYMASLFIPWLSPTEQMGLALAAYALYVINAAQFLLKLRAARLDAAAERAPEPDHSPRLARHTP